MTPEWVDLNRRTLRILAEVNVMATEVRALPLWGETWSAHAETRSEIEQSLEDLAAMAEAAVSSQQLINQTLELAPLNLPDAAYPDQFLQGARQMLDSGMQMHGAVLAILNKFRDYCGEQESPGSSLN